MRWITQGLAATTFGLALFCLTFVSARSPHDGADQQAPTQEFSQVAQPDGTSDQPGDQSSLSKVWHFVSTAIEQTAAVAAPASATTPRRRATTCRPSFAMPKTVTNQSRNPTFSPGKSLWKLRCDVWKSI